MAGEHIIQFIWKNRLYSEKLLKTACGCDLEIIHPGEQNSHAGPDFFNARIRLDHIIWAGNVEVHLRASDWYRHGHHLDPCYNNVILHVVGAYDTDVTNSLGRRIHTFVSVHDRSLIHRYELLKKSESWLPCSGFISDMPPLKLDNWLKVLYHERLNQKCHRIEQILFKPATGRDEALYRALCSGYGLPLNTMPFELLSKRVPLHSLIEHRDSIPDLEAMLFGHSGLLFSARTLGPYPGGLWNRYMELKSCLSDIPVPRHLWRFLRLRPASFPTVRISQFASLIHKRFPLSDTILETSSATELEQIFRTSASAYWDGHYLFGRCSPPNQKYPGEQFVNTLIINIILPFLIAEAKNEKRHGAGIRANRILLQLKAEQNQIIKNWGLNDVRPRNAMESQALLQLYNVYCKQKRCLDCQIGTDSIKAAMHEKE
jgi:hypothetical protein